MIIVRKKAASNASEGIFSFDDGDDAEDEVWRNANSVEGVISSFSFDDNTLETKAVTAERSEVPMRLTDNRKLQKQPYGITPPVDGEHFEIRRTFVFRRSTVRMLNKLKAEHEDENVYLSSIVDEAVRFYFNFVCSKSE